MYRWLIILILFVLISCPPSWAELVEKNMEYKEGDTTLEGYIVYNDELVTEKSPGVLVVHDWKGLGEYSKRRARELTDLGYVAMAVDIYGKGVRPKDTQEASEQATRYKNDRALMRARIHAALDALREHPLVDDQEVAAMGYCFGGTVALELARSGADIDGVVSFHGGLSTPEPAGDGLKARILVLHGADDPYVPPEEVLAFQEEMRQAGADWQMVSYGNAVHSFTHREAGNDNSKGAAYNQEADERSWIAMENFFNEIFEGDPDVSD